MSSRPTRDRDPASDTTGGTSSGATDEPSHGTAAHAWRALLSPRWLLRHALVAAVVVALVSLGLWQLRRLDEVSAREARIQERVAAAPRPFAAVADVGASDGAAVDRLEYRPVTVTGTYRSGDRVLQRSRSLRGRNGWHVLTPLATAEGRGVLVRRGWVPFDVGEQDRVGAVAAPPSGRVTVTGYLEVSDEQPGFGPTDPAEGRLETVFHADVDRLDRQTGVDLHPMVLHLRTQQPAQPGDLPVPAPVPDLDTGRHLSYAVQWFSFAVIATGAYGAFLWRRRRGGGASAEIRPPAAGPRGG